MPDKGHTNVQETSKAPREASQLDAFVLDKGIFSNVFDKDIRRVYIYKKAERLAKAVHLIAPAFQKAPALRDRLDRVAVGLVDSAILPPQLARAALSQELLALSSVLAIARTSGMLSTMNADLISRESHALLEEIAVYEEPRLMLEETPTLAALAKSSMAAPQAERQQARSAPARVPATHKGHNKGQSQGASPARGSRQEAILDVLKERGPSYIKDISTVVRDVSEKTIQRELQRLVEEGRVERTGERRWTTYSLKTA